MSELTLIGAKFYHFLDANSNSSITIYQGV